MTTIDYARHFRILILATITLPFVLPLFDAEHTGSFRGRMDWIPFVASFALPGALHSLSLAVSLRRGARVTVAIVFVALATILAGGTPVLALVIPWRVFGDPALILALVFASAFGASGYWLLVRLFWWRSLGPVDWSMTVGLCVPATLLGWFGALLLKNLAVLSAAWWFAFSGSLFLSEIRQEDLRNRSSVEKA